MKPHAFLLHVCRTLPGRLHSGGAAGVVQRPNCRADVGLGSRTTASVTSAHVRLGPD
jgi:hypothetical protein